MKLTQLRNTTKVITTLTTNMADPYRKVINETVHANDTNKERLHSMVEGHSGRSARIPAEILVLGSVLCYS